MAGNTYLGVGINFGATGTTITGSAVGTFTLQGYDFSNSREKDVIKDGFGTDVQATLFNPTNEATFEYVISAATGAAAITATVIPDIGAIITVANTTDHPALASTSWFVWNDPVVTASNVKAKMVKLHLKKWTGTNAITAVST